MPRSGGPEPAVVGHGAYAPSGVVISRFRPLTRCPAAVGAGWDHRATLKHLARKSGYRGKVDDRFLEAVALTRYQSSKAWLSYDQYKDACQG